MKKEIEDYIKKGEIPIELLDQGIVEKHKIQVGDITPFTRLKVISITK